MKKLIYFAIIFFLSITCQALEADRIAFKINVYKDGKMISSPRLLARNIKKEINFRIPWKRNSSSNFINYKIKLIEDGDIALMEIETKEEGKSPDKLSFQYIIKNNQNSRVHKVLNDYSFDIKADPIIDNQNH